MKVSDSSIKVYGPVTNRRSRDIFFLLLFILFWLGMFTIATLSVMYGDPRILNHGIDSYGQLCGIDNSLYNSTLIDLSNKPFLYYFDPINTLSLEICIESCPTTTSSVSVDSAICDYSIQPTTLYGLSTMQSKGKCTLSVYSSVGFVGRCIPTDPSIVSVGGRNSVWSRGLQYYQLVLRDLQTVWIVFPSVGVACVLLVFFIVFLLRYFAGLFVWIGIIGCLCVSDATAVYFWYRWVELKNAMGSSVVTDNDAWNYNASLGYAIVASVVAVVMFLVVLGMRKRVSVAIQILKEASKCVYAMPMIVGFPVLILFVMGVTLCYAIVVEVFLLTIDRNTLLSLNTFGINYTLANINILTYMQYYHLFGFLWSIAFWSGVNQMTLAGAVSTWYWTRDKRALVHMPVARSFYRVFRYHLGSVALGSLLIALVQFIRFILVSLERQLKGKSNPALKFMFTCLQCCFWCLEKFIKFLSKNAYIEIAVYGYSFCRGAREAFALLVRNALRLVAVDGVSGFIVFLFKVLIAAGCGVGVHYAIDVVWKDTTYPLVPIVVVVLEAWVVVSVLFSVYKMAVDTIFISFCEDCERNDGSGEKPYFMSDALRKLVKGGKIASEF